MGDEHAQFIDDVNDLLDQIASHMEEKQRSYFYKALTDDLQNMLNQFLIDGQISAN